MKKIATDLGATRVINRMAREPRHSNSPTYHAWRITLPSGATRNVDLPMCSVLHLEKRGLGIQPA